MPLDPDKLSLITEKAQTLSKRFDAMIERRGANAEDDPEDDDEEEFLEPAEVALRATPGSELANPEMDEPWYK